MRAKIIRESDRNYEEIIETDEKLYSLKFVETKDDYNTLRVTRMEIFTDIKDGNLNGEDGTKEVKFTDSIKANIKRFCENYEFFKVQFGDTYLNISIKDKGYNTFIRKYHIKKDDKSGWFIKQNTHSLGTRVVMSLPDKDKDGNSLFLPRREDVFFEYLYGIIGYKLNNGIETLDELMKLFISFYRKNTEKKSINVNTCVDMKIINHEDEVREIKVTPIIGCDEVEYSKMRILYLPMGNEWIIFCKFNGSDYFNIPSFLDDYYKRRVHTYTIDIENDVDYYIRYQCKDVDKMVEIIRSSLALIGLGFDDFEIEYLKESLKGLIESNSILLSEKDRVLDYKLNNLVYFRNNR